jgi:exopolysaccharide production protein ExoZ
MVIRVAFPESAWAPIPFLEDWGYLGVNFFFAIWGYVICLVVSKPTFTLRSFATKRLFRLYPMYWVVMAIVALMIAYGKYRAEPLSHFLYSMTLLPQQGASAYDISWTLEREMVFYMLAAIIVPVSGIYGLAITLAALALAGWWLGNPWSFHLLSTTQADFLAGVVVFAARPLLRRLGAAVPIAVGATLLWYTRSHDFQFSVTLSMAALLTGWSISACPGRAPHSAGRCSPATRPTRSTCCTIWCSSSSRCGRYSGRCPRGCVKLGASRRF